MDQHAPEILEVLWRFIRGDMPLTQFEPWAYESTDLEAVLGADLYLEVISTPFSSAEAVDRITRLLREFAVRVDPYECRCVQVADLAVIDMGDHEEVFHTLVSIRKRGEPLWWLSAYECNRCGQGWLIAQEERQNDVFCLRRLTLAEFDLLLRENQWPTDFDRYESLLKLGLDAGRSVRFVDPIDSSLRWTIVDLAKERPGIRVSELAELLNIDRQLAEELAIRAIQSSGAQINIEK